MCVLWAILAGDDGGEGISEMAPTSLLTHSLTGPAVAVQIYDPARGVKPPPTDRPTDELCGRFGCQSLLFSYSPAVTPPPIIGLGGDGDDDDDYKYTQRYYSLHYYQAEGDYQLLP